MCAGMPRHTSYLFFQTSCAMLHMLAYLTCAGTAHNVYTTVHMPVSFSVIIACSAGHVVGIYNQHFQWVEKRTLLGLMWYYFYNNFRRKL